MKSDAKLKEFWGESSHFADLYNTVFFKGKQVVFPEMLSEAGSDLSTEIVRNGGRITVEKYRDVFKRWNGNFLAVLGIENQWKEEFTLPERVMLYDALEYERQRRRISARHKKEKDLKTSAEYLCGFGKTDRLCVQATIVIYYGEEPWNGPRKLSDLVEVPEELRPYFNEYQIFVFSINESDGSEFRDPEVRKILKAAYELRRKRITELEPLEKEEVSVLAAFLNSERLAALAEQKEEGEIDMCTALEEMIAEGERRGEKRGEQRGEQRGRKQGARKTAAAVIRNLHKEGYPDEMAARILGWDVRKVKKFRKKGSKTRS